MDFLPGDFLGVSAGDESDFLGDEDPLVEAVDGLVVDEALGLEDLPSQFNLLGHLSGLEQLGRLH